MAELLSVATVVPAYCVTAAETKAHLFASLPAAAAARFARMVDASQNQTRYSVMPMEELCRLQMWEARNDAYARHAVTLAGTAAKRALDSAGVDAEAVETLICVTATGYMMPSLDTYLVGRLGLKPTCRRVPMMQLGCAGGVASIGLAATLRGGGHVLVVSVELPSLSFPAAEPAPTDILSSIQFGDGAAAAVVSVQHQGAGVEVLDTRSVLFPATAHRDGIRLTPAGLRLLPQRGLRQLVESRLPVAMREFLAPHGLRPEEVSFWVVHPRTPQVLDAVQESLQLPDGALRSSWAVWRRYGNVVSSTVFFVLRELYESDPPRDGDVGVMLAFGAGVACEMVLLRARGALN